MTNLNTVSEGLIKLELNTFLENSKLTELQAKLMQTDLYKEIEDQKAKVSLMEKEVETTKENIKNGMITQGIKSIESGDYKFTVKTSAGALVIDNEEVVPREYIKTKTTHVIDKKAIKDDIKEGKEVNGCRIGEGKTALLVNKK